MSHLRWLRGSCPRELYATLTHTQSLRIRPCGDEWQLVLVTAPAKAGHAVEAVLGTAADPIEAKAIAHQQYGRGWIHRDHPEGEVKSPSSRG